MAVIPVVDMVDTVVEDTVVIPVVVEVDEDIVLTQQDLTVTAMTIVNGIRIGIINGANHWNQSGITRSQKRIQKIQRSQNGKTSVMVIGSVHQNGISHQLGIDGQSGMMLLQSQDGIIATGTMTLMVQMMAIGTMLHTMDQVLMIMTVQVEGDQSLKI